MDVEEPLYRAIPGCLPWRLENGADLCPSVHCERCQMARHNSGLPLLEPYVGSQDG